MASKTTGDELSQQSEDSSVGGGDIEESSGDYSSSPSESNKEDTTKAIQDQLTKKETNAVFRLRLIVVLVLLATAVAICLVVFYITHGAEKDTMKQQYEAAAQKVIVSFEDIVYKMSAVSGLGVAATSYSVDHESNWPFVTQSNFRQKGGNARYLSKVLSVSISPILLGSQVHKWNEYVNSTASKWTDESYSYQQRKGLNGFEDETNVEKSRLTKDNVDPLHYFSEDGTPIVENVTAGILYLPIWQTSPVLRTGHVNENLLRRTNVTDEALKVVRTASVILGSFLYAPAGNASHPNPHTAYFATLRSIAEGKPESYRGDPLANLYFPVYDFFVPHDRNVVGIMTSTIYWRTYLREILPENIQGIKVVLDNSCDGYFTYELNGEEATAIGFGDQHDTTFDDWKRDGVFRVGHLEDGTVNGIDFNQDSCRYSIHVYPTQTFIDSFTTKTPLKITLTIMAVLVFTIFIFLVYDRLVERRQGVVLAKATQSTAIVSSLFPANVRDRLLNPDNKESGYNFANKNRLKGFLNGEDGEDDSAGAPIADLFPHCTVFFCDIAGFTAWSSTRDPAQVFILLQSVYQAFDVLAKRRKVFKVETIGDSYMAVTGLPEPQDNHAVNMVRFALECVMRMRQVVKDLECSLGPDTGELNIRVGLHSGPVTAGVLRGDRARFQLFGDTVNTASRMESTGVAGKVQVSSVTANLLREAGKEHWLNAREDSIVAKGKGVLSTFFVNPVAKHGSSVASDSTSVSQMQDDDRDVQPALNTSVNPRLVNWMVDLLMEEVRKVVLTRKQIKGKKPTVVPTYHAPDKATCLDEVKEVISMPTFDADEAEHHVSDWKRIEIPPSAVEQLREFVTIIASMYRKNPFHNFEHACHVTMSVKKLLKRIVAPELSPEQLDRLQGKGRKDVASHLHDYTHGITSDPLLSLAITFSALIHDTDHRGVSNMQLMVETPELAALYNNKSIAEQNSLDLSWEILMQDQFQELRLCLFSSQAELMRFRQLIVNVVLATDIFDRELNDLRKSRWNKAFSTDGGTVCAKNSDLRATIVIEHIIQASDVSHTMQHWHVYQKWNRCLFRELYAAYKAGRMGKDPSTFWYQGEIGFFDNYIIPLAKKLKNCGVFGVSSDEYLNYAVQNRAEWEERGQDLVNEMMERIKREEEAEAAAAAAAAAASAATVPEKVEVPAAAVPVQESTERDTSTDSEESSERRSSPVLSEKVETSNDGISVETAAAKEQEAKEETLSV